MPRKRGNKNSAMMMAAIPAVTSHAMADILPANDCPFKPINCSADRFVNKSDPAIKMPVSPRPAKK